MLNVNRSCNLFGQEADFQREKLILRHHLKVLLLSSLPKNFTFQIGWEDASLVIWSHGDRDNTSRGFHYWDDLIWWSQGWGEDPPSMLTKRVILWFGFKFRQIFTRINYSVSWKYSIPRRSFLLADFSARIGRYFLLLSIGWTRSQCH